MFIEKFDIIEKLEITKILKNDKTGVVIDRDLRRYSLRKIKS